MATNEFRKFMNYNGEHRRLAELWRQNDAAGAYSKLMSEIDDARASTICSEDWSPYRADYYSCMPNPNIQIYEVTKGRETTWR